MYFWNIKELIKSLDRGLTEKENFRYLLAASIVGLTIFFIPNRLEFYDVINSITTVVITVISLLVLYKINGGDNGKNFLSRYFAINFVVFIRSLIIILLPLSIIYGIFIGVVYGENIPTHTTIYDVILTITYSIGVLFLNIKYLKQLLKK